MRRVLFIFLAVVLWHSPASAQISKWGDTWYNSSTAAYAACSAQQDLYLSNRMAAGGCDHVVKPSGNYYRLAGFCGDPGVIYRECFVYLYPDVPCSDGIDSATGQCLEPKPNACEATNQVTIFHEHKSRNSVSDPEKIPPPLSVCSASCQYTFQYVVHDVYVYKSGEPPGVFHALEYKGNGFECSEDTHVNPGSSSGQQNPDETPPPDPDNKCPAGYIWNGTFCSPSTPPPDPTDPDPVDPTDPDSDGDGDGDGGDTGGGDTGGGDTGGGDTGGGDTGGGGPGNGTGDGEGQCDPATDPNKCGQSSVSGEACNVDLKCEGDAIQCAILRMNKDQVCQWTYDANVKKQIADEMAGEAYQLEESSIPVSGLFSDALNKGRWLPQTCPAPQTINVMGNSYSFSWEPLCRFATAMAPIIVALASIFFAVYIGRALKGS